MLRSYFTIALKHLISRKLYSAINILGLAVGLGCVILILLFVRHELGFDEHWARAERIYRISADYPNGLHPAPNVNPAAPMLEQDFPQAIERAARIWGDRVRLGHDELIFYEDGFRWADPALFEIFDFDWLAGDPATALAAPGSVVLTESLAARYFGTADPVGQMLMLENRWPLRVTGLIADLPATTHLTASAIASPETGFELLGFDTSGNWSFWNFHTYVLLREGAVIETVEAGLPAFLARHRRPFDAVTGMTAMRLADIHLRSNRLGEFVVPGSLATVMTFTAIAISILLIACINFMNLSTALSSQRAREVGMRKAAGAERAQIVRQFLGETVFVSAIATLLAIAIAESLLPAFNSFVGRELAFNYFAEPGLLVALAALALLVGVIAGSYPAFYLSAFNPAKVLKGDLTRGKSGAFFRSTLVVFQFSISIALIIMTAIVYAQREYARAIDTGFRTEQIVVLAASSADGLGTEWPALRRSLQTHPNVTHATAASMRPEKLGVRLVRGEGGDAGGLELYPVRVGIGFFETYDIDFIAGRAFSERFATDRFVPPGEEAEMGGGFVLNELAARALGWNPEEAVGKWFEVDFAGDFSLAVRGTVIGVVENTYNESIREPLKPIVYYWPIAIWGGLPSFLEASVRIGGGDLGKTLDFIDETWAEHFPDQPVSRRFVDEDYEALYRDEQRQARMFGWFSLLAIVIACMGLVGLAAYMAEQRSKEIGMRKVVGGSVASISFMLTKDFAKLVLAANVIAWPVTYLVMQRWLAGFAYRIDLSPLFFIGGAAVALVFAWVTVGGITARAASINPVRVLRYE